MSLVDAVGNPVILDREEKEYSAGGLRVKLQATPEDMLQRALAGAQKMAGQQAGMIAMQKTGSQAIAQQEAMEVASKVTDPFAMEPAALAVFFASILLPRARISEEDGPINTSPERSTISAKSAFSLKKP